MIVRAVAVPFFVLGGGWLVLMSLLGAPSFWYVPCFCALVIVGLLWSWRPSLAASLSIGPLVAFAALLRYLSGLWLAIAVLCLVCAVLLLIAALDIRKLRL